MDEALILIGLKAGDKQAYNLLYDLLYEQVCFYVEQIIKDEMEAEDIAIHSLAKFWEKGPKDFENFLQVRTFIFRTARNAAVDFLRKTKVQQKVHRNLVYMTPTTEENSAEQAELALYKIEMLQALVNEIERLPDQCREAFKLVFIENMSRHDVAGKLNISLNTVHSHCANAKRKLQQIFSEKELIILLLLIGLCPN
jgi:RNA polymerase sigma-70 factor (ECF subfamily)